MHPASVSYPNSHPMHDVRSCTISPRFTMHRSAAWRCRWWELLPSRTTSCAPPSAWPPGKRTCTPSTSPPLAGALSPPKSYKWRAARCARWPARRCRSSCRASGRLRRRGHLRAGGFRSHAGTGGAELAHPSLHSCRDVCGRGSRGCSNFELMVQKHLTRCSSISMSAVASSNLSRCVKSGSGTRFRYE